LLYGADIVGGKQRGFAVGYRGGFVHGRAVKQRRRFANPLSRRCGVPRLPRL
jgi:hypothetical protein